MQADLYVMQDPAEKPCVSCPFSRASLPGWLGPWTSDQLLFALGREPFPCHMTIPQNFDPVKHFNKMKACAGMAIFLNNKMEKSRHPQNAHAQECVNNAPREITQTVFSNAAEFSTHHAKWKRD